ncbi:hypothetical protein BJ912DRAFT_1071770 [Pholiota molesta]|nr:hypothetical protein BJ912DRAFT_1071770 [Pholiota molesta]
MAQQSGIELRFEDMNLLSLCAVNHTPNDAQVILMCQPSIQYCAVADGQQPGAYGLPDDGWDSAQRPGDKANLLCSAALRASTYSGLSGYIDYNEFKTVFSANLGPDALPFDFDWSAAPCIRRSLIAALTICLQRLDKTIPRKEERLAYNESTQLMKGLQGERLRQAFKYLDTNEDGFIPALPEWLIQEGDWK